MSGTHLAGAAPLGPAGALAPPSPQLDRPELCAVLGVLVMAIFPPITPRAPTLSTPSVGVDTVDTLDSRDFPLGPGWAELYPRSVLGCLSFQLAPRRAFTPLTLKRRPHLDRAYQAHSQFLYANYAELN